MRVPPKAQEPGFLAEMVVEIVTKFPPKRTFLKFGIPCKFAFDIEDIVTHEHCSKEGSWVDLREHFMKSFYGLGNSFQNFGFHRTFFHLYLFSGWQLEFPVMIEIFYSFPAVAEDFKELFSSTVKSFEHVICDLSNASNGQQGILCWHFGNLFSPLREKSLHFEA